MSRPVGRHRARRNTTGFGALRRPAVAATAAISTVSVAAAAYSTTATASATVVGTAQAKVLLGASTSTALRAADMGVAADSQAKAAAAQHAVSARKAADAKARSAAAAVLQRAAKARVAAAKQAAERKAAEKKAAEKEAATKAAATKVAGTRRTTSPTTSRDSARPPAPSFSGSPQAYASSMLSSYGWDQGQLGCLVSLWTRESSWQTSATNPSSGAYGIPQSLPGSKMASAGADWRSNPATQIRWGLGYIRSTYGSPCGAWGHSQATGWY